MQFPSSEIIIVKLRLMLKFIIVCLAFASTFAKLGIDFSFYQGGLSESTFKCFKDHHIEFISIQSWEQDGSINPHFKSNYETAKKVGISEVDTYAFVCDNFSADHICDGVKDALPKGFDGHVWLDIEPSGDCWTKGDKVEFVASVAETCQKKGLKMGVYSSLGSWAGVMGSDSAKAAALHKLPLWYAHYDGSASFSDFSGMKFGGWEKPSIKQYAGDSSLCGVDVDLDYE